MIVVNKEQFERFKNDRNFKPITKKTVYPKWFWAPPELTESALRLIKNLKKETK